MKNTALVLLVGFLWTGAAQAQVELPDWDTVEIKTIDLGGGVYMLEGFGGNIGVLAGDDGVILVDDQYAMLTEKIVAAVTALSAAPVRFVINTHWHPDHTGGNENLGAAGAIIVAHDESRRIMLFTQEDEELKQQIHFAPGDIPVITFSRTATFHINGETVEVRHIAPAHTSGDAIVIFKNADVIHTGDAYFNGFYPFIDVRFGGSIDGMIAFYDELLALAGPDTQIIPGHGPVAGRDDVRDYQAMLRQVRDRVAKAIADGVSLDDLIAAEPLADLDPKWGGNLIKAEGLLRMVHGDLSRGQ